MAIRPKLYWAVYAWFGVALCLLIAVVMPIDTARRAAAGKKGIEMGAVVGVAVAFGVLAVAMAVLAVRLSRSAWVIDATGLRKQNWRTASVRWDQVSGIELKLVARYWQVWVHAPGAVEVTSSRQSRDRLILPATIVAPHPDALHAFLVRQWQQRTNR
ncbi:MAG: hypothetical protein M3422_11090 [Actinomycetota bacterium]|nr:hypothetical protein [Actinomycetota bacterium]